MGVLFNWCTLQAQFLTYPEWYPNFVLPLTDFGQKKTRPAGVCQQPATTLDGLPVCLQRAFDFAFVCDCRLHRFRPSHLLLAGCCSHFPLSIYHSPFTIYHFPAARASENAFRVAGALILRCAI